jgi:hypothetical protein
MSPASRPKAPLLLLAAIVSVVSIVGAVVVTGLLAPGALRGDGAPLAQPADKAGTAAEAAAIRFNDPSICPVCGVVEAVRPYEIRATSATAPGADARASADANLVPRTAYRVTVRMEDGSYRTLSQPEPPAFKAGERVRVVDGAVVAR